MTESVGMLWPLGCQKRRNSESRSHFTLFEQVFNVPSWNGMRTRDNGR